MADFGDPTLITDMIYRRIDGHNDHRMDGLIHASSATGEKRFCPRAFFLQTYLSVPPKEERVHPLLKLTFDQGKDKQWRLNNEYLRDVMVGIWRCPSCGVETRIQKAPKNQPCNCTADYEYEEVTWRHQHTLLTGSTDMLIEVDPTSKLLMVEVKIIAPDEFKKLKMPLAEHTWRTQLYLHLIANSTRPEREWVNTDFAHVLYCCRSYGAKINGRMMAHREFRVTRDDEAIKNVMGSVWDASKAVEAKEAPQGICDSYECKRAQLCSVRDQCFSGAGA